MAIKPITPKRPIVPVASALREDLWREMDLWGKAVAAGVKRYPPRSSPLKRRGFVSDKQRKYVMAAIREGLIKVPYTRTKTLSRAATNETEGRASGDIKAKAGVNLAVAPYGGYVVGPAGVQAADMANRGWPRIDELAKAEWKKTYPKLVNVMRRHIQQASKAG